ncbi:SMP-30/gluconolactonase/LRE family protein [Nocardia sp. NBC_01329]|uniref:SMP-30/gluconolactonase/LRE family protein n=1 Tax=Nocardia sp. NBC_01329 TaxID=2903594 RepID=UPI002E112281|nr:superoxide dismutase [Nocardia sp. NBC_01329]
MRRALEIGISLAMLGAALVVPGCAERQFFAATIELPAGFAPEGIAIGSEPVAYLGSRLDGTIYRVDLRTGHGSVLSPGPGTPALGLALDPHGRLFVAGGTGGDARVVDTGTGEVLARYRLGSANTFVNDVVLTPAGAWFTDSYTPVLYHLPLDPSGVLPPPDRVVRLPLSGDIEFVAAAINANGIVGTPDGAGLILVQSATGRLYRVDPVTGAAKSIDLGTESVPYGDGMLWHDGRLLVVQNRLGAVAEVELDDTGARGTIGRRLRDARFDVPTTVAAFEERLYLPNARFTTPPAPGTTYDVVAIGG